MKKKKHIWLLGTAFLSFCACTEEIVLDAPEGRKVPVVEGSFSDEYKRHEVILSYSSELYSQEHEMISGAVVYIAGGGDTIYYYEQEDKPGHYLTDSVAGVKRRRYHLEINVAENTWSARPIRMYAEVYMPNNARGIDSLKLLRKSSTNQEDIPFVQDTAAIMICPYFQALSDPEIVYNVELYLNDAIFRNRPSKLFDLFQMRGYAGYYFNGPEMLKDNIEVPVGVMNTVYLHEGDKVGLKLYSISKDYMYYLLNQKLAIGVNPIMGAFPAMFTNIFSNCNAIGWFSATSVIKAEQFYHIPTYDDGGETEE